MKRNLFFILFFSILFLNAVSQTVYEHISNKNIYDFLDELANEKFIELNNMIKPYSRKLIFDKLKEVEEKYESNEISLSKRQEKELAFYLDAYFLEDFSTTEFEKEKWKWAVNKSKTASIRLNPPGIFYKDSVFHAAVQPILGASYSNNENGSMKHTWGFASMYGYIGKHFGFYGNVRDNDVDRITMAPDFLVNGQGVIYKVSSNVTGMQYSQSRGGLAFSNDWMTLAFVKDNLEWGEGYHGTNIQSGHAPSFARLVFNLKPVRWFEFNYYHGWLVSSVIDSSASYWLGNQFRAVFYGKYMAANMFTVYPFNHLNISFGNSIIYTNENGGGPKAVYFIPFLFYKSVDINSSYQDQYGYASNNNHMYLSISSRNIKYLHLYFSLFADDFSISYFRDKEKYNSFSYKLGWRLSNFPVKDVAFTFEWTRTNPYVFQHHMKTQDYTSNNYNMGHYLRDNAREFYSSLSYKPFRGLHFILAYTLAQHGDDYDINNPIDGVHIDPFLKNIIWQNSSIEFDVSYEIVYNAYVFINYKYRSITGDDTAIEKFTPEYYKGKTNTFNFGANIGF